MEANPSKTTMPVTGLRRTPPKAITTFKRVFSPTGPACLLFPTIRLVEGSIDLQC